MVLYHERYKYRWTCYGWVGATQCTVNAILLVNWGWFIKGLGLLFYEFNNVGEYIGVQKKKKIRRRHAFSLTRFFYFLAMKCVTPNSSSICFMVQVFRKFVLVLFVALLNFFLLVLVEASVIFFNFVSGYFYSLSLFFLYWGFVIRVRVVFKIFIAWDFLALTNEIHILLQYSLLVYR